MAGPFARIIANLIVVGAGIVSKAFVQAYQQAVVNAKSGKTVAQAANTVSRRNKMDAIEAMQVLNFEAGTKPSASEIQKKFEKYFETNDPAKGGSFYLQSKIYRAKEALENEVAEKSQTKE